MSDLDDLRDNARMEEGLRRAQFRTGQPPQPRKFPNDCWLPDLTPEQARRLAEHLGWKPPQVEINTDEDAVEEYPSLEEENERSPLREDS